jgi:hypothetical protein
LNHSDTNNPPPATVTDLATVDFICRLCLRAKDLSMKVLELPESTRAIAEIP